MGANRYSALAYRPRPEVRSLLESIRLRLQDESDAKGMGDVSIRQAMDFAIRAGARELGLVPTLRHTTETRPHVSH